jgi:hypothetical protein
MSKFGIDVDAARSLDFPAHKVHEGDAFVFAEVLSLGSAAIGSYILTAPSTTKRAHLFARVHGVFGFTADIYEGANTTPGAASTVRNRNRNSATTPGMSLAKTWTGGSTDGTLLEKSVAGSPTVAGVMDPVEWVLDQDAKYVLKFTSSAAGNSLSVRLEWYEHQG